MFPTSVDTAVVGAAGSGMTPAKICATSSTPSCSRSRAAGRSGPRRPKRSALICALANGTKDVVRAGHLQRAVDSTAGSARRVASTWACMPFAIFVIMPTSVLPMSLFAVFFAGCADVAITEEPQPETSASSNADGCTQAQLDHGMVNYDLARAGGGGIVCASNSFASSCGSSALAAGTAPDGRSLFVDMAGAAVGAGSRGSSSTATYPNGTPNPFYSTIANIFKVATGSCSVQTVGVSAVGSYSRGLVRETIPHYPIATPAFIASGTTWIANDLEHRISLNDNSSSFNTYLSPSWNVITEDKNQTSSLGFVLTSLLGPGLCGDPDATGICTPSRRKYLLYTPQACQSVSCPLVVLYHGAAGNAVNTFWLSGMAAEADASHFVIAFPEALVSVAKYVGPANVGPANGSPLAVAGSPPRWDETRRIPLGDAGSPLPGQLGDPGDSCNGGKCINLDIAYTDAMIAQIKAIRNIVNDHAGLRYGPQHGIDVPDLDHPRPGISEPICGDRLLRDWLLQCR